MSFNKRLLPILKAHMATIKTKLLQERVISRLKHLSKTKLKLLHLKFNSKTVLGVSSVFTLCAGVAVYTNYDNSCVNTPKLDAVQTAQFENRPHTCTCEKCSLKSLEKHYPEQMKCNPSLSYAIAQSRAALEEVKRVSGAPGMSVCVSLNGKILWSQGFGFADVEQMVRCHNLTVMRIASISKSLTMIAVAKLMDQNKVNIEEIVQTYVPQYPSPLYKGKKVIMKVKHILSHTSGIRHYCLWCEKEKKKNEVPQIDNIFDNKLSAEEKFKLKKESIQSYIGKLKSEREDANNSENKYNLNEFLIKEKFSSIEEALQLFQNDELFCEPGTKFKYTTHGWTLTSAVVEGASGKKFETFMNQILSEIGLKATCFEKNNKIIKNRAKQYVRVSNGRLENAPYVDNSYKFAGGGFLSTVEDLVKFANVMLYSYQRVDGDITNPNGYIQQRTMEKMWTPSPVTETDSSKSRYGLGWFVLNDNPNAGMCVKQPLSVFHTGHAMGGSSVLLIKPENIRDKNSAMPHGIVVAILANLEGVNLFETANSISNFFNTLNKTEVCSNVRSAKHSFYSIQDQA